MHDYRQHIARSDSVAFLFLDKEINEWRQVEVKEEVRLLKVLWNRDTKDQDKGLIPRNKRSPTKAPSTAVVWKKEPNSVIAPSSSLPFLTYHWTLASAAADFRVLKEEDRPRQNMGRADKALQPRGRCGNDSQEFTVSGIELINRPFRQTHPPPTRDNMTDGLDGQRTWSGGSERGHSNERAGGWKQEIIRNNCSGLYLIRVVIFMRNLHSSSAVLPGRYDLWIVGLWLWW